MIIYHRLISQGHQLERAKVFVKILSRTSAEMLRLFDGLVTVDDVKVGSEYLIHPG